MITMMITAKTDMVDFSSPEGQVQVDFNTAKFGVSDWNHYAELLYPTVKKFHFGLCSFLDFKNTCRDINVSNLQED